MLKNITNF